MTYVNVTSRALFSVIEIISGEEKTHVARHRGNDGDASDSVSDATFYETIATFSKNTNIKLTFGPQTKVQKHFVGERCFIVSNKRSSAIFAFLSGRKTIATFTRQRLEANLLFRCPDRTN